MNVVIDIETIPCQHLPLREAMKADASEALIEAMASVKAPGNYKDADKIAAFIEDAKAKMLADHEAECEQQWLKTSFDGGLGQVCVIGVAVDDEKAISFQVRDLSADAEASMLSEFYGVMKGLYNPTNTPRLIGHNLIGFDLPFLWKRSIIRRVRPPVWFPKDPKPWDDKVFDTMTAWAGTRDRIKLNQLCRVLGLEGKGDMDGSKVWPAVEAGEIDKVAEYCRHDVDITRAAFKRMTFADVQMPRRSMRISQPA